MPCQREGEIMPDRVAINGGVGRCDGQKASIDTGNSDD